MVAIPRLPMRTMSTGFGGLRETPEDIERQRQLEAMFPGMAGMVPNDDPAASLTRLRLPNAPRLGAKDQALLDQSGAGQSNGWGDKLATIANALGAAQSFASGDAATGGSLLMAGARARQASQLAAIKAQQTQQIMADLVAQGIPADRARLMALNPEAIGTNAASHMGAYSLSKGEQRYNNNKVVAERPDLFENKVGDRYSIDAAGNTKEVYRETAPDYHSVEGVGVFAMDRHKPGVMGGGSSGGAETYTDPSTGETYQLVGSNRKDPNAWQKIGGGGAPATGGFRSDIPSGSPLDPPRFRR